MRKESDQKLRILLFSTLFPSAGERNHGIFVANRLKMLLATGRVEVVVVAPVPWFPFRDRRFGRYAAHARVPAIDRSATRRYAENYGWEATSAGQLSVFAAAIAGNGSA